jgi:hypothetical protein
MPKLEKIFMFKKFSIFIILTIISFATFWGVGDVLADTINPTEHGLEPSQCCKLKHAFCIGGTGDYCSGGRIYGSSSYNNIVGSPDAGAYCPLVSYETVPTGGRTPNWAGLCMLDAIVTIADWIFYITMLTTAVALVFAGFILVTSGWSPDRVAKAKKVFWYSLLGVLVAVGAKFIPALARFFIGI